MADPKTIHSQAVIPEPERMVIVETHRPVAHRASGFNAPVPGRHDFPYRREYGNWLRGQQEQGNLTILGEEPAGVPETSEPPQNDGIQYAIGAEVVYTTDGGNERRTRVVAVNEDGTYELKGGPKSAPRERLLAVAGEPAGS